MADPIYITGMAVRCGSCENLTEFWSLLTSGRVASTQEHAISQTPLDPVKSKAATGTRARISNSEMFDHEFFGFTERDAALLDPQQRIGLEVAWHALEDASIPQLSKFRLGVYASISSTRYLIASTAAAESLERSGDLVDGCKEDFFASRLAIALNATGPVALYGTACSSSLFSVAAATKDLRAGLCDVAIICSSSIQVTDSCCTGTTVRNPLHSPDGICRPYDDTGGGFVPGDAVVAVVLERRSTASARAYAELLGVGVSNDGANRMSFAAPSPKGQAEACAAAFLDADVKAGTMCFVEGHGSGTRLGDVIELEGLGEIYGDALTRRIPIGSVKGNVGHCDVAAGIIGLVKAVLSVYHRVVVPTVGFERPTRVTDWTSLPFYVPTQIVNLSDEVIRAGVNSIGMGGTNVHVVVGSVNDGVIRLLPAPKDNQLKAWCVSAKTAAALEEQTVALTELLRSDTDRSTDAETCASFRHGRASHPFRRYVLGKSNSEIVHSLERCRDVSVVRGAKSLTASFGGLGTITLSDAVECCALVNRQNATQRIPSAVEVLSRISGPERPLLDEEHVAAQIAMAHAWRAIGIQPTAVVGYSLGEISALAVAGVLYEHEALLLARERRMLFERSGPPSASSAICVYSSADRASIALRRVQAGAFISSELAPNMTIVSGTPEAITAVVEAFEVSGTTTKRLDSTRAAHTPTMIPFAEEFKNVLTRFQWLPAQVPIGLPARSGLCGAGETLDSQYLVEQLHSPLRWHSTLDLVGGQDSRTVFLELNRGPSLCELASSGGADHIGVCSFPLNPGGDLARADAELWANGIESLPVTKWSRKAIEGLPSYPFQRFRCALPNIGVTFRSESTLPAFLAVARPSREEPGDDGTAPEHLRPNSAHELVLKIFKEEGGAKIDVQSNFFAQGGTSLAALNIVARIRAELNVKVGMADFLENSTAAALSVLIQDRVQSSASGQREGPKGRQPGTVDVLVARIQTFDPALYRDWQAGLRRGIFNNSPILSILTDELFTLHGLRVFPHELTQCCSFEDLRNLVDELSFNSQPTLSHSTPPATRNNRLPTELVEQLAPVSSEPLRSHKNPPMIFVLCSPRSGSTLLRVLLAGHPELFAPPELHLLPYTNLADRASCLSSSHFGSGLVVAWRELNDFSAERARREVQTWERNRLPIASAYAQLQALAQPRLLVDKSPDNAREEHYLNRIDELFRGAFIIYLHRHPVPSIESYVRNRLYAIGQGEVTDPWQDAERTWLRANKNILRFLGLWKDKSGNMAPRRPHLRIAYEDLVVRPEETMKTVCCSIGVNYVDSVISILGPGRMKDGPGDPGFSSRREIDSSLAWSWRDRMRTLALSAETSAVARVLGYSLDGNDGITDYDA